MPNKSVIVVFRDGLLMPRYWTNIKDCTKELGLPYWTIARLKCPIRYKEFKIVKLNYSDV